MGSFKFGTCINTMHSKRKHKLKYIRFCAGPLRGKYLHRFIAEIKIGRPLLPEETVDHIDGNTLNNDPANLSEPISLEEHGRRTAARLKKKKEARRLRKNQREKERRQLNKHLKGVPF